MAHDLVLVLNDLPVTPFEAICGDDTQHTPPPPAPPPPLCLYFHLCLIYLGGCVVVLPPARLSPTPAHPLLPPQITRGEVW
ncbi:hypothetical protein E2C01_068691 [Portunus trituberculatus]|uniref:Uncharacterized protein n=1 Tax=Portunus trituberculatus TaxID=210409 RepID=A0A5B7I0S4_PORTR|nr:hypothetical protein [Portunus trituberculatus]